MNTLAIYLVGDQLAETAGLSKELSDARTNSGFSFNDLCADLAGITFAQHVLARTTDLASLSDHFVVKDYLPSLEGLRDGMSWRDFTTQFGGTGDRRFTDVLHDFRRRIAELPGYHEAGQPKAVAN